MTTTNMGWTARNQRPKREVSDRFWEKVDKKGEFECSNWTAALGTAGYGHFRLDGRCQTASRVSYLLAYGEIPDGLHVCHTCDNPACVNPGHLWLGTNDDNNRDKMDKGRQAKGEAAGRAVLTESDVIALRDAVRAGATINQAVRKFGFPHCTVYSAVYGVTWKHVPGALPQPRVEMDMLGQSRSITARQLRDATATYVGFVERGMEITITSDGAPIAVMSPPKTNN